MAFELRISKRRRGMESSCDECLRGHDSTVTSAAIEVVYDEPDRYQPPLDVPPAGTRSPITAEVQYTPQQQQFLQAMDRYKRENRRPFPTWSEVLAVLESLGYRQVAEPTPLPTFWRHGDGEELLAEIRNRQVPRVDTLPPEHRRQPPPEIVLAPELAQQFARGERSVTQIAVAVGCSRARAFALLRAAGVLPRPGRGA